MLYGKRSDRVSGDLYETPEWATVALMEREVFVGDIWEPACGNFMMSRVIERYNKCKSTDISLGTDFLMQSHEADNIITNPPFFAIEAFIDRAKVLAQHKIAFLAKLQLLESYKRYPMFADKRFPLKTVYVFCGRVNFLSTHKRNTSSSTMAMAWFVWDKEWSGSPTVQWISDKAD